MNLLPLLVEKEIIKEEDVATLEQEVLEGDTTLEQALIKRGVSVEDILTIKGEQLSTPIRILEEDETIPYDVLKYVPKESATHYQLVPLAVADGILEVGIVDPDNIEAIDALNFISSKTKLPYKIFLIAERDFEKALKMYDNISGEVDKALTEFDDELSTELDQKLKEQTDDISEEDVLQEDAPVTKIVATILRYAVEGKASDIHIEGMHDKVRVRFRVDGVLTTSLELPQKVLRAVVARVKILCSMRLDERRKPQDGRFSATVKGRKIDFRVSTMPTYYGEKVVMRILDNEKNVRTLEGTGLRDEHIEAIREAVRQPYGMILISGPTGSGKSTTLLGMLQEVDRQSKNVVSLEDPIEYNIDGVSQSQVRPEIGYTFANGLRSILRQDPDVIMVGEIRDKETAQLAIQAALTGHLVLSTIHTNNAAGVIPRLVDMGVDPYLIAPTLILTMAQRLVRRLCPNTGRKIPVGESIQAMIDTEFKDLPEQYKEIIPKADHVYGLEKTPECPSGTRGRIAVMEMLHASPELAHAILTNPSDDEIYRIARSQGMITLQEDALIKAMNGEIPFEEVNTLSTELAIDDEPGGEEDKEPEPPEELAENTLAGEVSKQLNSLEEGPLGSKL